LTHLSFTLHILSDTPGGFQWLKYIFLRDWSWLKQYITCLEDIYRKWDIFTLIIAQLE
jgi:hypothetical protein